MVCPPTLPRTMPWIVVPIALAVTALVSLAKDPRPSMNDVQTLLQSLPTDGDRAHAAIEYFERYYEDAYFSSGRGLHDMGGTGFYPYMRMRWFYEQRADHSGKINPMARWDAYVASKQQHHDGSRRATANWTSMGPNPIEGGGSTRIAGRMLCHAFLPGDSQTIFAGSNGGGLWKTTDGGGNWAPVTDQLPSMRVSSVAIHPVDSQEMLIGTGAGWSVTTTLQPGIGALRSTDGGLTWAPTSFAYPFSESSGVSTYDLVWDPVDVSRVHLAATNGTWLSTDKGQTWSQTLTGETSAIVIDKTSPHLVYAAVQADGVYKSTDSGVTYAKLTNGLPSGSAINQTSLAICEDTPSTLYTAITDPVTLGLEGLYRTNDSGASWTKIVATPNFLCSPGGTGCAGWLFNAIAVAPDDPERILVAGVMTYLSTNGGQTWTWKDYFSNGIGDENEGLVYVDHFSLGFDPEDSQTVYAFNDGGVFKSTDKGEWWDHSSDGLNTSLLYRIASSASDENILASGTQDHGCLTFDRSAGNQKWIKWTHGDGGAMSIDHGNPLIIYGDLSFGFHIKTNTGGTVYDSTPTQINLGISESGTWLAPTVMDPSDPRVLYYASTAKIYKTTNGGGFWATKANIANVKTIAVDRVNPALIYAHSYTGSAWAIWRSTDAGENWVQITTSSIPTWRVTDLEVDPSISGTVYATRNSAFANVDHVKRSTNSGLTWTDITNNLPDVYTNAIAISPHNSDHLYVGTDLGVFASTDAGANWQEWNDGMPLAYVSDIHYHEASRTIRIATLGRGAWLSPALDSETSGAEDAGLAGRFDVLAPAPNPFVETTRVAYRLQEAGEVRISVHNALGQLVTETPTESRDPGAHSFEWDGRDATGRLVGNGTYFLRVAFGNTAISRRVSLLR